MTHRLSLAGLSVLAALALVACPAPKPAGAAAAGSDVNALCPGEEPEPAPQERPVRPRPFVDVIPREDVELTPEKPARDVAFGSAVCKAGQEVWRDQGGRIRTCTIARRVTLFGIDIAAGAYSHFWEDGRPYQTHIARPMELVTAAGEKVQCKADFVLLSKAGALEHCTLARSTTIGKVACRGGESVAFHPGGQLSIAVIDQPLVVSGTELHEGTLLYWFESGAPAGGVLGAPTRIGGTRISSEFGLHESGALRAIHLAEARTIHGQKLPERAIVELRKDGSLQYAEFEVDRGFMPHGEMWTDTKHVRYDCASKVSTEHTSHYQAEFAPHPPKW